MTTQDTKQVSATNGGANVREAVTIDQGDFVGRDKIVYGSEYYIAAPVRERPSDDQVINYLLAIPSPGEKEEKPQVDDSKPQVDDSKPKRAAEKEFYALPFCVQTTDLIFPKRTPFAEAVQLLFQANGRKYRQQCAILLSEAGGGKTLALWKLRKELADKALPTWQAQGRDDTTQNGESNQKRLRVPILVTLSNLDVQNSLIELVRAAFNGLAKTQVTSDQIEMFLPDCILLLDGLDEFPAGGGLEKVRLFIQEHSLTQYVATARSASYGSQLGSVTILNLADLTLEEVEKVVQALGQALSEPMKQLARNRTMLRLIIDAGSKADISTVYSKGKLVQVLLRHQLHLDGFDNKDDSLSYEQEALERLLERVGYALQKDQTYQYDDQQMLEVTTAHLLAWHEGYSWRDVIQKLYKPLHILDRKADGRWVFRERLTQAYFAAAHVARNPSLANSLLAEGSNPWWSETLQLYVGLCADSENVFLRLIDQDPVAAARCLSLSGVSSTTLVAKALFSALVELLSYGRGIERENVVNALAQFEDAEEITVCDELMTAAKDTPFSSVLLACARAYRKLIVQSSRAGKRTTLDTRKKIGKLQDELKDVLEMGLDCGTPTQQGENNVENKLEAIIDSRHKNIRAKAASAIVLGILGSDTAQQILLTKFQERPKAEFLNWCIAEALTQFQGEEVYKVAQNVYNNPKENPCQKARAVYLLGWARDKDEIVELLFDALAHNEARIRRRAAQSIGRMQPKGAKERLEHRLRHEADEEVVGKTVQALATLGTLETLPLLQKQLRFTARAGTRRHIRTAINTIQSRYYEVR